MKTLRNLVLSIVVTACGGSGNTDAPVDGNQTVDGRTSSTPDAPSPSGPTDPANDGAYAVTTANATITGSTATRMLSSTVFTPTGAPSPRPLVIVSPGFQLERAQYTSYARHLATWGFVVIVTDYASSFFPAHTDLAADASKVIDYALAQSALAVDPQRIALAGHSLGGKISVLTATSDARVKAVVAWDPVDTGSPSVAPELMTNMTAAVAVLGETTNSTSNTQACAPAAENYTQYYAAAPSPALSVTLDGADHMDWVDDPTCFFCGFCDPGTASSDVVRKVTRRVDVAWLRRVLFDDTTMDAWLDAPPELAAGAISISRR